MSFIDDLKPLARKDNKIIMMGFAERRIALYGYPCAWEDGSTHGWGDEQNPARGEEGGRAKGLLPRGSCQGNPAKGMGGVGCWCGFVGAGCWCGSLVLVCPFGDILRGYPLGTSFGHILWRCPSGTAFGDVLREHPLGTPFEHILWGHPFMAWGIHTRAWTIHARAWLCHARAWGSHARAW